jgi:ABC-2 type transport system permease protein
MTELVLRHPAAMIGRSLRMSRRNVDSLLTSLMLPVMLMLLFV